MKETPYKDLNQGDTTKLPTKEITFPTEASFGYYGEL